MLSASIQAEHRSALQLEKSRVSGRAHPPASSGQWPVREVGFQS